MPVTQYDITSQALVKLGAKPLSSQAWPSGDLGDLLSNAYQPYIDFLLSMYEWSFATKEAIQLTAASAPDGPFPYAYTLPADMISSGPSAVFESNADSAPALDCGWRVVGEEIYADYDSLYITYQYQAGPDDWTPAFRQLAVTALAAELAPNITQVKGLTESLQAQAFGMPSEGGRGGLFALATTSEASTKPFDVFDSDVLTDARFGGV